MRRLAATIISGVLIFGAWAIPGERAEAAQLSCAQMKARGYSYTSAVAYWRTHGYPSRLDADNNGIPCETVYSAASVRVYWGSRAAYGGGIESGLLCRDLLADGYTYAQAVGYWRSEGYPARMDADNNGIPCETVYSAAEVRRYYRR